MPEVSSHADITQDWTGLIDAADRNPDLRQSADIEYQALKQSLTDMQSLKLQQADLKAQRQEVTQKLKTVIEQGREAAMRIRSIAKGKLGPRSERLVHFSVAPLRRRPRKPAVVVKPPDGETPGVGPDVPPTRPVA